ncbi:hypothetical protein [Bacillus cereus]|nr:hypothetical protein [Bacillus cereus]
MASRLPTKQKALQGREFQCPAILNEPLALLILKRQKQVVAKWS